MKNIFKSKWLYIGIVLVAILAVSIGLIVSSKQRQSKLEKEQQASVEKMNEVKQINEEKKAIIEEVKEKEQDTPATELSDTLVENSKKYTTEYKEYQKLSPEKKKNVEVIPRKEVVQEEEIDNIVEYQEDDGIKQDDELPTSFNLRDKINIKTKDQEDYDLCWDFASNTSLETNLLLTKGLDYDISESHIDYMTAMPLGIIGREPNSGGNFSFWREYMYECNGFVTEEVLPLNRYSYDEYISFPNYKKENHIVTKTVDFPDFSRTSDVVEYNDTNFNKFQKAVKNHIMNYGSLYATVAPFEFNTTNLYYNNPSEYSFYYTYHAISIIGWDDSYSRNNFVSPDGYVPEIDGAYIALNSWGSSYGDNGVFYISYDDDMVNKMMSGVVSVDNISDMINVDKENRQLVRTVIENTFSHNILHLNGQRYFRIEQLNSVMFLDASNMNIDSLDGLECFNNLLAIDLSNNNLTNVENLSNIKYLLFVDISNNKVKDVSSLANLSNLWTIDISNNKDITGFNTVLADTIIAQNSGITDLNIFDGMDKIIALDISNNDLSNNSVYMNLPNLEQLSLTNCNLNSIETIKNERTIKRLDINKNNIGDLSILSNNDFVNLNSIDISENKDINDYKVLENLPNLEYIKSNQNEIVDAAVLPINDKIVYYELSGNKGISNLDKLVNAKTLILRDCNITDVSEIARLQQLAVLDLSENKELSGSLDREYINYLILENCGINNEFDFFGLSTIEFLNIKGNNLKYNEMANKIEINKLETDSFELHDNENAPYLVNTEVYKTIIIPRGKSKVNYVLYIYSLGDYSSVSINNKKYAKHVSDLLDINENCKIDLEGVTSDEMQTCNMHIRYVVGDVQNYYIMVSNIPDKVYYEKDEEFDPTGMKISNVYNGFIFQETEDYTVDRKIKLVGNGRGIVTIRQGDIFINYYVMVNDDSELVHEESNEGEENNQEEQPNDNPDNEDIIDNDENINENEEEKGYTLVFNSDPLFMYMKELLNPEHIIKADEDSLRITISKDGINDLKDKEVHINADDILDAKIFKIFNIETLYIDYKEGELNLVKLQLLLEEVPSIKKIYIIDYNSKVTDTDIMDYEQYVEVEVLRDIAG